MTLRLLVLGNSQDLIDGGDGRSTTMWCMAAAIEQHTRETVELRHVIAYPNPGLARYTARVVDDFDPDIVLLHCSGYVVGTRMFTYRMQHVLGRRQYALYDRLRLAVQRRIDSRGDAARARDTGGGLLSVLYYGVRKGLIRAGLADTQLTLEQATEAYAAVIRYLAARESLTVLVRGPLYSTVNAELPRIQAGAEARVAALDAALASQCRERRISYCGMLPFDRELRPHLLPDRLHRDREGNAMIAAMELRHLPAELTGVTNTAG